MRFDAPATSTNTIDAATKTSIHERLRGGKRTQGSVSILDGDPGSIERFPRFSTCWDGARWNPGKAVIPTTTRTGPAQNIDCAPAREANCQGIYRPEDRGLWFRFVEKQQLRELPGPRDLFLSDGICPHRRVQSTSRVPSSLFVSLPTAPNRIRRIFYHWMVVEILHV